MVPPNLFDPVLQEVSLNINAAVPKVSSPAQQKIDGADKYIELLGGANAFFKLIGALQSPQRFVRRCCGSKAYFSLFLTFQTC